MFLVYNGRMYSFCFILRLPYGKYIGKNTIMKRMKKSHERQKDFSKLMEERNR
jgi:hypothetical protein